MQAVARSNGLEERCAALTESGLMCGRGDVRIADVTIQCGPCNFPAVRAPRTRRRFLYRFPN